MAQARTAGGGIWRWAAGFALATAGMATILALQPGSVDLGALLEIRPHAPDLAPLARQDVVVQLHVWTVFYALVVGPIQFLLPKGTRLHRQLGWSWFLAMLVTALSSLFIREINHGGFSFIHLFSAWTFVSLPLAIWTIRRGDVRAHRGIMVGLYVGLVIAGVLAIAPGRVIWDMFFG